MPPVPPVHRNDRVNLDFAIPADLDRRVEMPFPVKRKVSFDPVEKRYEPDYLPTVEEVDEAEEADENESAEEGPS